MSNDIILTVPYNAFLKSRTAVETKNANKMTLLSTGQVMSSPLQTPDAIIIGPLNADLNFTSLRKIGAQAIMSQYRQTIPDNPNLPVNFDWVKVLPEKITPVQNQGKCGSCWAFAVATALSDNFVTQQVLPVNPMISPTYLLSCYSGSSQCNGGNPALAMEWISKNGIETNDVVNYDWCLNNPACNGETKNNNSDLNTLIPQCVAKSTDNLKFFINNITTPTTTESLTDDDIRKSISIVKNVIFARGPVVVGFHVYKNFYSGQFTCNGKNPDNIYLDSIDYDNGTYNPTKVWGEYEGGHAVVVTGWGIGKVSGGLLGKDDTEYDVPYWVVRNTWTTKWGIDGYFRMAMYPFNTKSQFDRTTFVVAPDPYNMTQTERIPSGGFLLFDLQSFGYDIVEGYSSCDSGNKPWVFFILVIVGTTMLLFLLFIIFRNKKMV